eukprot:PITA_27406
MMKIITAVHCIWALIIVLLMVDLSSVDALIASRKLQRIIHKINRHGPYLGIVVPNAFEMDPLLQSSSFNVSKTLDIAGRRFHIGSVHKHRVIIVMSGLAMLNSGLTTQLLLSFFEVKGVIHYGIAGNANSSLHIGYVTVPRYWVHTGLWNWQRYGDGPNDELSLESNGDYTRKYGYLHFGNFTTPSDQNSSNLLNNVWYQPEEVFPVDGTPEVRQHAFWVPVDKRYYHIAKSLESLGLQKCLNSTTCLSNTPKAVLVERGASANVFVDNAGYRNFLYTKFKISPIDMESAAVALVCLQQRLPFIAIRSLSDLAGGGTSERNEAAVFSGLASQNAVTAVIHFIKSL